MASDALNAFILDMDGTLIDNMPVHTRIWVAFLAELGIITSPREFHEQTAGKNNAEILRLYLGADVPDAVIQSHSAEKEIRYRAVYRDRMQPVPGVLEFIHRARQAGIPLGLATSADNNNIDFVLNHLGLHGSFAAIVNGDEVRRSKPDPEIFETAARRLETIPERCLVFEDSRSGILAAQNAGMAVVAITTSLTAEEALAYPNVRRAAPDFTGFDPLDLVRLPAGC